MLERRDQRQPGVTLRRYALWLIGTLTCLSVAEARSDEVHMTVVAYDDRSVVNEQLAPLLAGFSELLPQYELSVEVVDLDELESALAANRTDVILTNPYHFLLLRERDHLAGAIGTIYRHSENGLIRSFGGTIVVRSDRVDITSLEDLRGRVVAIDDRRAAAGYVLPLAALRRAGVNRWQLELREVKSQRAAIDAVLAGDADAAFLRSSLLEALLDREELGDGVLKVLNRQALGDYPFAVSTRLYPEWPLVFTGAADLDLRAQLLGAALLRAGDQGPKAAGALAGLTPPADYTAFQREVEALALPPFEHPREVTVLDIWRSHRVAVIGFAIAAVLIGGLLLALAERNRRLRHLWQDLRRSLNAQEDDRRRLADLNRHFELFLDKTTDFVFFKDAARRYIFVSKSFANLSGENDRHALEGRTDSDLFAPDVAEEYLEQDRLLFETRQPVNDQRQHYQRPDGSTGWVSTHKWPVFSPEGDEVLGLFGISRDVTALHDHEKELERAAHYDALTGLPNRNLFYDRLHQAMAAAQRRATELAVAYLDIDKFKEINDQYGHSVGDELLQSFAEILQSEVRRSDTVCRLGGDEFALLLADLGSRRECLVLMDRLMQAIAQPVHIAGQRFEVTASAGLAFYSPGDHSDSDQLLRQADQAMYRAKQAGRNRYRLLDQEQDVALREFLEHVREAMEQGDFELHYQPIVDMRSGEIGAAEALLRWRRGGLDLLLPDEFLPQVFGHPLALKLERWALTEALQQQARWRELGLDLCMHINVTASDISAGGFVETLAQLLEETVGVTGNSNDNLVALEILESTAVADAATVNAAMDACAALGVRFALDDFGTGYSSISHVKDLRAHSVKVDKRFIQSMYLSYDDFALLSAILALARAFDREVVAEGVETIEQGEMLLRLGVSTAQGFAIARPMPAAAFEEWAREWEPHERWRSISDDYNALLSEGWSDGREAWLAHATVDAEAS